MLELRARVLLAAMYEPPHCSEEDTADEDDRVPVHEAERGDWVTVGEALIKIHGQQGL